MQASPAPTSGSGKPSTVSQQLVTCADLHTGMSEAAGAFSWLWADSACRGLPSSWYDCIACLGPLCPCAWFITCSPACMHACMQACLMPWMFGRKCFGFLAACQGSPACCGTNMPASPMPHIGADPTPFSMPAAPADDPTINAKTATSPASGTGGKGELAATSQQWGATCMLRLPPTVHSNKTPCIGSTQLDVMLRDVCSVLRMHCLPFPVSDVSQAPTPSPTPETPVDGGDPTANTKTATLPASGTGGEEFFPAACHGGPGQTSG